MSDSIHLVVPDVTDADVEAAALFGEDDFSTSPAGWAVSFGRFLKVLYREGEATVQFSATFPDDNDVELDTEPVSRTGTLSTSMPEILYRIALVAKWEERCITFQS